MGQNLTPLSSKKSQLELEVEEARSESRQLERLTRSLATSANAKDLAKTIVLELKEALQADALALFLLNELDRFDLISESGCTEKFKHDWKSIPRSLIPLERNFSFQHSLFTGDGQELKQRIPDASELIDKAQRDTICYAPLFVNDSITGFIGFSYNVRPKRMPRTEFVIILFNICAQSSEAMRLRELGKAKRLEAQLANQAKSDFLTNICHEIRTPVGVIKGFADMLCESGKMNCEQDRWAQTIQRNAQTLNSLIGEVLDFSVAENQEIEKEMAPFDLHEMVANIDAALRFKASEKGLRLVITSRNFPKQVISDQAKLKQILLTLINNSIMYTNRGHVLVDLEWSHENLNCTVADSGIGICPTQREVIFKPRLQPSPMRALGGNKIGISTARTLARALGGELELTESTLGAGSIFSMHVECPEFKSKMTEPDPAATSTRYDLTGVHILLVEDCVDNQDLITHLLARFGAKVDVADSGTRGLEMALNQNYAVILLDIQLPAMDGRQVLKTLRTLGYKKPIVALTALAIKSEKDKSISAGFDDYLTKPVRLADLLSVVKHFSETTIVH